MESFYKQTTIANTVLPNAFTGKFDSFGMILNLHYQIVLNVADETSPIEDKWRLPFYKFLAGCVKTCGGKIEAIGGTANRIHLLVAVPSTTALAEFLREVKLLSQTWARRKMQIPHFLWQDESCAFTVSATQRERVKAYIQRQNAI